MSFHLQQATLDDYALSVKLLHDADEDDDSIRAAMANPNSTTYITYDGAIAIGAAVMSWLDSEAEITHIAVNNGMRGRGFGKQMIEGLMAQARLHQMQAIIVGTANSSIDNIAFYQKCGFRMDHVRQDYFSYVTPSIVEGGILMRDMIVFRLKLD